jgi:SAM-dependent methyltransferase
LVGHQGPAKYRRKFRGVKLVLINECSCCLTYSEKFGKTLFKYLAIHFDCSLKTEKPFWESAYQTATTSIFGKPSAEIVTLADKLPAIATVLDLGCGEGRNALFLAERGFDVTVVDISKSGFASCGPSLHSVVSMSTLRLRTCVLIPLTECLT